MLRRNPLENDLIRYIQNDDIESFQLIVDSVFSVNYKFTMFSTLFDDFLRYSPCLLAVSAYYKSIQIFRYLLVNGADLYVKDKRNFSLAHFAVCGGDFEILHLLDEYSVSFDGTLFTAAEQGYEDVFKWILYYQSEDLHRRKNDGTTLVDASSKGGNWKLTQFILDSIKDDLTISEALRLLQLIRETSFYDNTESSDNDYDEDNQSDNINNSYNMINETYEYYSDNDDEYGKSSQRDDQSDNSDNNENISKDQEYSDNDEKSENTSNRNEIENSENDNGTENNEKSDISNSYETESESENDESKNTKSEENDSESEEEEEDKNETEEKIEPSSSSDSETDQERDENVEEKSEINSEGDYQSEKED